MQYTHYMQYNYVSNMVLVEGKIAEREELCGTNI